MDNENNSDDNRPSIPRAVLGLGPGETVEDLLAEAYRRHKLEQLFNKLNGNEPSTPVPEELREDLYLIESDLVQDSDDGYWQFLRETGQRPTLASDIMNDSAPDVPFKVVYKRPKTL
jgi:hypothetical protein